MNCSQTCDAAGQWVNGMPCPFLCTSGICAGVCSPGKTECDGATLLTCDDEGHRQGHDCLGTTCTSGFCEPTILASGQEAPWDIAVGATHVYWVNSKASTVMKVAK